MPIELYAFPPSPRAFKVIVVANHLGIETTLRLVDIPGGAMRTPEYVALNPNMRMPTMKDGDFVLWESNAIMQYLAAQRPESGLLPTDERGRLDVTRWQFWDLAHWDSACATFIFEHLVKKLLGVGEPDQAGQSVCGARARPFLDPGAPARRGEAHFHGLSHRRDGRTDLP